MAFIFDASKGETPESIKRKRDLVRALMGAQGAPKNVGEGLNALGDGIVANVLGRRADNAESAGNADATGRVNAAIASVYGGGGDAPASAPVDVASSRVAQAHSAAAPSDPNVGSTIDFAKAGGSTDVRQGIIDTAQALGIDPVDLGTAISYETAGTFDPTKKGPTTQWGQHKGLIQFGEPQAKEHGVDWNNPVGSQLGPNGAVASYLRSTGVQPGMGMLDIYSAINAGGVGRYNRSDANNGGAPGTVRDKVEKQMAGHRQKALALIGQSGGNRAVAANEAMATGQPMPPAGQPGVIVMPDGTVPQRGAQPMPQPMSYGPLDAPNVGAGPVMAPPLPAPRVIPDSPVAGPVAPQQPPQMQSGLEMAGNGPVMPQPQQAPRPMAMREPAADMMEGPGSLGNPVVNAFLAQQQGQQAPQGGGNPIARIMQALGGGGAPQAAQGGAMAQSGPMQGSPMPSPQGVPQGGNMPIVQQLITTLQHPHLSAGQRAILEPLLERELQKQDPMTQLEMEYKRAQIAKMTAEGAGGGAPEYGLTPQYGVDEQGNPVLIQLAKDGTSIRTPLPEGVALAKEPIKMDAGTHFVLLDPISRQVVGQIPKENRQEAFDKGIGAAEGKAVGEANIQLPQTIASAEQSLANIDAVINDPNLGLAIGAGGILPAIPGTAQAGVVARIEQLQGAAFLQAFETLKGGGQITEVEGRKATDAIARLNRAQRKEDFLGALNDLKGVIQTGLDRAKSRGGVPVEQAPAAPPAYKAPSEMTDEEIEAELNGR